jgi:hypothetical protein
MQIEITIRQAHVGYRSLASETFHDVPVPRIGEKVTVDYVTGMVTEVRYDFKERTVYVEAERD